MLPLFNFCAKAFPAARWELAAFPFASVLSGDYGLHLESPPAEPAATNDTEPFPTFDPAMTAEQHERSQCITIRVRSKPLPADKLFSDIQIGTSRQRANVKNLLDGGLRLIDTSNTNYPQFGAPLTRYPPRSPTDWTFNKRTITTQRSILTSVLTMHFKPEKRGRVILGRWFEDADSQLRRAVPEVTSCWSPSTTAASSPETPSSSSTAYSASAWAPVQFVTTDVSPASTLISSFSPSELEALGRGQELLPPTASLGLSTVSEDILSSAPSSPFQSIPDSPVAISPSAVSPVLSSPFQSVPDSPTTFSPDAISPVASSPFQSIPDDSPLIVSPIVISPVVGSASFRPRSLESALISPNVETFLEFPLGPPMSPSVLSPAYSVSCSSRVPDSALFGGFDLDDKDFMPSPPPSTHDGPVKRIRRFLRKTRSLCRKISYKRFN